MTVSFIAQSVLPTKWGIFELYGFEDKAGQEHVALTFGLVRGQRHLLTRIHSECLTGDAFGSLRCDCGEQLDGALRTIVKAGAGILVYLRQEGRGIGLLNKIKAYALQDEGLDTVEANEKLGFGADQRDYATAGAIYRYFDVDELKLLTNNPKKVKSLEALGITVAERVPMLTKGNPNNCRYLKTKSDKLGHML